MERLAIGRAPAGSGIDLPLHLITATIFPRLLHLPNLRKAAVPLCLLARGNRAFGGGLFPLPIRPGVLRWCRGIAITPGSRIGLRLLIRLAGDVGKIIIRARLR